ncbi:MAG: efflux RND transporter periplasmic adaptor subunit [Marinifilaceae bacterium]
MKKRYVVLAAIAMLNTSCFNKNNGEIQNIVRPVRIEKVSAMGQLERVYTGVVEAKEYSNLAFKVSGPLVKMNVDAGEKVRKGAVIASVDPLDYQLQNDANKAAFITAKSQLERNEKLLKMQAISKQEFEVAEAKFVQAKSAYEASQNTLKETQLVAPFDGFVEKKFVENYQKVQVGEPIIKLVNPGKLQIGFIIPETSVELTRVPMTIKVEFDTYKGTWFDAKVKDIVDASPDGSGIPVKLEITDERFARNKYDIYPGFSCKVQIQVDNNIQNSFAVPLSAVFDDLKTNQTCVWLYDSTTSKVTKRAVTMDQLVGSENAMISAGIANDDLIVVAGVNYITEGQTVKVLK